MVTIEYRSHPVQETIFVMAAQRLSVLFVIMKLQTNYFSMLFFCISKYDIQLKILDSHIFFVELYTIVQ